MGYRDFVLREVESGSSIIYPCQYKVEGDLLA